MSRIGSSQPPPSIPEWLSLVVRDEICVLVNKKRNVRRNMAPDLDAAMHNPTQAIRDRWDIARNPARVTAQHKDEGSHPTLPNPDPK